MINKWSVYGVRVSVGPCIFLIPELIVTKKNSNSFFDLLDSGIRKIHGPTDTRTLYTDLLFIYYFWKLGKYTDPLGKYTDPLTPYTDLKFIWKLVKLLPSLLTVIDFALLVPYCWKISWYFLAMMVKIPWDCVFHTIVLCTKAKNLPYWKKKFVKWPM